MSELPGVEINMIMIKKVNSKKRKKHNYIELEQRLYLNNCYTLILGLLKVLSE